MRVAFLLLFQLLPLFIFAQLFMAGEAWFEESSFFDAQQIQSANIKSIEAQFLSKKDGALIKESRDFFRFRFQRDGLLDSLQRSWGSKYRRDTATVVFHYGAQKRLIAKENIHHPFHFKHAYEYDADGELLQTIKIDQRKNAKDTIAINRYQNESGKHHKTRYHLNDKGLAYLAEEWTSNSKGNLLQKRKHFLRSSGYYLERYEYRNDRLVDYFFQSNLNNRKPDHIVFYYDVFGRLEKRFFYKNDELRKQEVVVYNEGPLPESIVVRYFLEERIEIIRLKYQFY